MKLLLPLLWAFKVVLQFIKGHVAPLLMAIMRERVSVGSLVGSCLLTVLVVWYVVRNKTKHYIKENEQGPSSLYKFLVVSVVVIVLWMLMSSCRQELLETVKFNHKGPDMEADDIKDLKDQDGYKLSIYFELPEERMLRHLRQEGSVESQPATMPFSLEDELMHYEFGSDDAENSNMGCGCGKLNEKFLAWIAWITAICTRKFERYHITVGWALVLLLLTKTLVEGTSNILRLELKVPEEETTIGDPVPKSFKEFLHDHMRGIKDQHDVVHSDEKEIWTDHVRQLSDHSFPRSWSRPIQACAVPFSILDEHLLHAALVSLVLIAWAMRIYITGIHVVELAPPIEETAAVGLSLFNGMMLLLDHRLHQLIRDPGNHCLNQRGGIVGQQINSQCQGTQPRQGQPQCSTAQPHYQDTQLNCQETQSQCQQTHAQPRRQTEQSQHQETDSHGQEVQATKRKTVRLPRPAMSAGSVTGRTTANGELDPTDQHESADQPEMSLEELQDENTRLRDYWQCRRCHVKKRTILFSPCNHMNCCETCAPLVKVCPQCGVNVAKMMVVHTHVRPPND